MNALRKALADYFVVRRALGFKLYRAEKLLGQFLTFVENRGEDHLTTEIALAWATLPQRGRTWAYARLSVVRRFATHDSPHFPSARLLCRFGPIPYAIGGFLG
jgi:hypothetical protein